MRAISTIAAIAAAIAYAGSVSAALITFIVPLDGRQEIFGPTTPTPGQPNAGDLDGTGSATLRIDSATNTISWDIAINNVALPVAAAHIHNAAAGVNGPIVIDFSGQLRGSTSDPDVAALLANPNNFYVNVHNAQFPAGAVRGQIVSEPATLALIGLVLFAGLRRLRRT